MNCIFSLFCLYFCCSSSSSSSSSSCTCCCCCCPPGSSPPDSSLFQRYGTPKKRERKKKEEKSDPDSFSSLAAAIKNLPGENPPIQSSLLQLGRRILNYIAKDPQPWRLCCKWLGPSFSPSKPWDESPPIPNPAINFLLYCNYYGSSAQTPEKKPFWRIPVPKIPGT